MSRESDILWYAQGEKPLDRSVDCEDCIHWWWSEKGGYCVINRCPVNDCEHYYSRRW